MRPNLFVIFLSFIVITISYGQEVNKNWNNLNFLIGNWKGEGGGKPGEGEGYFSFQLDLNNNILIRKSHSEYPAMKDKPLIIHDDLMIIYPDSSGKPDKAIYFDNEGHVINYSITFPNINDVVFTSNKISNEIIFKLTYSKVENDLVNVKFEISRDSINYITYVEGKSRRTK